MRAVVGRRQPMFASCFGFQALVQALGGKLVKEIRHAELGTHEIRLTQAGALDPLMSQAGPTFWAQLGHNDSAVALPPQLECVADSSKCPVQAVRVKGAPIWATQFHPELTDLDNITRYLRYIKAYKSPEDSMDQARHKARAMHWPSPKSNALVGQFMGLVAAQA